MHELTFGQRIVAYRAKKSMTQKELAEKMGILPTTLSRYENDIREPNVLTIIELAKALDVTGDDLLGCNTSTSPTNAQSEDEVELLNSYRSLSNQGKEYIRQTMVMALNTYKKGDSISDVEAFGKHG